MADTYTTASKARLIEDNTRSGTWGPTINADTLELIDDCASGVEAINLGSSTSKSMAAISNGSDSETRAKYWVVTGTPASAVTMTVPASLVSQSKMIFNQCGQSITVGYSSGTTVTIPTGTRRWIWCDGSNVVDADSTTGTFTPTFVGSGTAGSPTYSVQVGRYQKYGELVHVQFHVAITAKTSMAGNVTVAGLPFPIRNTTNLFASIALGDYAGFTFTAGYTQLLLRGAVAGSSLLVIEANGASDGSFPVANLSATSKIIAAGSYFTD